ncbi:MAG: hypothetical protein NVV63_18485 [Opitutus sp.]|nr:hypothetical protein [Opitutus sp.]
MTFGKRMLGARILILVSLVLLAGCAKLEVRSPVIAIWESAPDAPRHVRLELYPKRSVIDYGDIHIEVVTKIRGDALFWVSEPDSAGQPQAGTEEVQFATIQKNRDLVIRFVPALADDSKLAPYVLRKKPNQALQPTPTAGTSAAEQPLVPAAGVADL